METLLLADSEPLTARVPAVIGGCAGVSIDAREELRAGAVDDQADRAQRAAAGDLPAERGCAARGAQGQGCRLAAAAEHGPAAAVVVGQRGDGLGSPSRSSVRSVICTGETVGSTLPVVEPMPNHL